MLRHGPRNTAEASRRAQGEAAATAQGPPRAQRRVAAKKAVGPAALAPGAAEQRLHELIENLARDSSGLEARFTELQNATDVLRDEFEASARRLRVILSQLELAERNLQRCGRSTSLPSSKERYEARAVAEAGANAARVPCLGPREREVLKLLTDGLRSPCIADRLGITTATVEVHRRNIMRKLNLHSVAALTKYALRSGIATF